MADKKKWKKSLIKESTRDVVWPIDLRFDIGHTISAVADSIRKQYPESEVWIHSIFITSDSYVGFNYNDDGHEVKIKRHPEPRTLRPDHLEIFFIVKPD